jgi:membrane protein YdbS with pleckstrin-like domain
MSALRNTSRYLAADERIVLETRRHWSVLLGPGLTSGAAIGAASLIAALVPSGAAGNLAGDVLGLIVVVALVRIALKSWQWSADRVLVSDQRILEVSGVLSRRIASMPIEKVTDMTYRRSLLGRLLGYGDLVIEAPGQREVLEALDKLPHPDDFYRTVTSLVTAGLTDIPRAADEADTGPLPRVVV